MESRENDSPGAVLDTARDLHLPAGPEELHTIGPDPGTFAALARWIPAYGDFFCVQSRDRRDPSFVVSKPEHLKHILLTNHENYTKGVGFERVKMLLGNGIIVSDGEEWRRQRTMMQPGFSRANIARLSEPMRALNLSLRGQWDELARNRSTIDITTAMSQLGLEIILRSIFSSDLDQLKEREGGNPFAFLAEDTTRDLQTAVRFRNLARLILGLVAGRRATGARPFDFLSLLMDARDRKSGKGMTDKELLDEVNTLIIAGHETSAGTLNWAWYLLSQHREAEERVLAELAALTPGDDFSFDQLMGLNYTTCVLKETLRLYPPVWLFSRRARADDQLGGQRVPAGAHIFIAPYFLHRRPELWPDPERFDPERFDETRSAPVDRYAFIPFSAGARRCIGDYFSFVEMQMHLALLAPHFALGSAAGRHRDIRPGHRTGSRRQPAHAPQHPPDRPAPACRLKSWPAACPPHWSTSWPRAAASPRFIHYLNGQDDRRSVSFGALRTTALGVLFHLQAFGAQPGDRVILHTSSNEQFIDGFWACLLGGLVPVPVAVGISDDHRHEAAAGVCPAWQSRWSIRRRSSCPGSGTMAVRAAAPHSWRPWRRARCSSNGSATFPALGGNTP